MNQAFSHDALFEPIEEAGDYAIKVEHVSKRYALFSRPEDRLKQMVVPRLQRTLLMKPKAYFKEFAAVNNVSLTVKRGETIGIIGRNGSGKSTLLQMIVGTLQPTSGQVNVKGRIAGFNPEFTGRENVYVNGAILGFSRAEMDERFESIAAFAGIGDFIERPVKTYSSGMYVRLAFAVATAVEPDILVVDEALSVGDEAFQRKCFARIEAIKERGGTILFVSHGAPTIVQLCDRAVLMDGGEKILEGEPKLVVGQYQRLVNASDEGAVEIRNNIWALSDVAFSSPEPVTVDKVVDTHTLEEDGLADYFDPNLKSESIVTLEQRGALVVDIQITSLNGKPVNVLRVGKRYVCQYTVEIESTATNLGFGFWFRTVSGFGLGGGQTIWSEQYRTKTAEAGDRIKVQYEFDCNLLSGVYFASCGLFGTPVHLNEQVVMHRIVDALSLRVIDHVDPLAQGIVFFNPSISLKKI
jgi:lipopolysaccharide transport system ATP-binding protein